MSTVWGRMTAVCRDRGVVQDLHYAQRFFRKRPGFTLVAILTLGLGVGACTAIFSVVNAVLLYRLPYGEPGRLAALQRSPSAADYGSVYSYPTYREVREHSEAFDDVAAFTNRWLTVDDPDGPQRVFGVGVTSNFFSVLRVVPILGRTFLPGDDAPGKPGTVVLSHGLWQRHFGATSDIVGRTIGSGDQAKEIIGVMPPEMRFDLLPGTPRVDFWESLNPSARMVEAANTKWLRMVGRFAPASTLANARAELALIADRISRSDGQPARGSGASNRDIALSAVGLKRYLVGDARRPLLILLGAVGFVLLIACVNIANLLLALGVGRQREFAVRTALGAGRRRLVRQVLTESVLLALAGGALASLLVAASLQAIAWLTPDWMTRMGEIRLDWRVFLFTLAVSMLTSLLFGLVPALQTARRDLQSHFRQSASTTGGTSHRFRGALVVVEVALSVILLVGAGLTLNSFVRLTRVSSGFETQNVLTMSLRLLARSSAPEKTAFVDETLQRIRGMAGVEESAVINLLPSAGQESQSNSRGAMLEGPLSADPEEEITVEPRSVTPGYFKAMGIKLLRGRLPGDEDTALSAPIVVVSEQFAQRAWPGEDPIGRRILLNDPPLTVVGVVSDIRSDGPTQEPTPLIYSPFRQSPSSFFYLTVRTSAETTAMVAAIRRQVLETDPRVVISDVMTMEQRVAEWVEQPRFYAVLSGLFGTIGMFLAMIGLYSVISYMVSQKTHEIGIRTALGAQGRDILKLVVGHGAVLIVSGLGVGLVGALALSRLLSGLLFGVSAVDPATYASVTALLLVAGLAACYLPERRATTVDPLVALRTE